MIAVIDYGAGNLQSVANALSWLGEPCMRAASEREILSADAFILPGVGEFGTAMRELESRGIKEAVKMAAKSGRPFLGICLGMQLLFESSEESPGTEGLSLIKGSSLRFDRSCGLKIPHTGWNSIKVAPKSRLFKKLPQNSHFYFVHSYYIKCAERAQASASCSYGADFDAAAEAGNLFGCQFHPEKSGTAGLTVLQNFINIIKGEL